MHWSRGTRRCCPAILLFALAVILGTGCGFPRDPMGTLERVRGEEMRVGVAVNEPWTRMGEGRPSGVEVELVRDFAGELDAEPVFVRGSVPDLLQAIKEGDLDVVIGGFTDESPGVREQKEAGITRPYLVMRRVVGVPPSREPFDDLSGREVAVERMDASAAYLKQEGATPVRVENLSGAERPVVGYGWQIEAWGFETTDIQLPEERHVMAVPPGENGWLVRLERFLSEHRDEARRSLREETLR